MEAIFWAVGIIGALVAFAFVMMAAEKAIGFLLPRILSLFGIAVGCFLIKTGPPPIQGLGILLLIGGLMTVRNGLD